MKNFIRLLSFVKPYWKTSAVAVLLLSLVVITDLVIPRLIQRIIDDGIMQANMSVVINSALIMLAASAIGMVLATTAGYAFSRWTFPGAKMGMSLFLVTQMFPGVVMAVPLYILLDEIGMLDSMLGLALVYSTTAVPFCTWNLKGYFDTIPVDLEEAALMDGASRWVTFTRIILPLSRPALVVTGLFSFMTAWNEFILAATFMSDERAYTLPVVLNAYVGEFGTEWGHFAAGAILVSLPVMALFFLLQRFLVEGLTAGSVKG